jgi:methylenetetrahydrofolate dehydrogenase (NADP+)/methenyltetrahydrofolate cyclohydrolase
MAVVLKGSEVAKAMKEKMTADIGQLSGKGITPHLGIVRLGEKPDDLAYERSAIKKCEGIGIKCTVFQHPAEMSQQELIDELKRLNDDPSIHGILLFRPLPKHIDENVVKHVIEPGKDVDCFNPVNVAKVFEGDNTGFAPCTPEAVMEILDFYQIPIEGKNVVVVGRSMVVGKPAAMMLIKKNGTVTICHTRTRNIEKICRDAEILVAAAGKAEMITGNHIGDGAVVIDVGINVNAEGKLCGDVNYAEALEKAGYVTPVPGGVGTVTTSILARHVVEAAKRMGMA